jgi:DNA-binding transcriptional LysR family regulator
LGEKVAKDMIAIQIGSDLPAAVVASPAYFAHHPTPKTPNDSDLILAAALAGQGIAYLFEDQITDLVAEGQLIRVLTEWCPTFPGYYLYHLIAARYRLR